MGIFGPLLAQILFNLAAILTSKSPSSKANTLFENFFRILNFSLNGRHLKFTVLVHFGAPFTTGKPKILLKNSICAKTPSLGIQNNVSPRSQKNHRILVKLDKKTFYGPKLGLNWPLCPHKKVIRNSHIVHKRNIPLHVLDANFQFLCICRSRLYLEETTMFFWFRTQLGPFWGFFGGGNNSSKQTTQIELKFWPQVVLIVVQIQVKAFWKNRIFTEAGCTQSLTFLFNFDTSLPSEIKNSHQVIQIRQNQGPISIQLSMKTIITFYAI